VVVSTHAATVPPGNYVAVPIASLPAQLGFLVGSPATQSASTINSIGQVLAGGGLWTPVVANSRAGSLTTLQGFGGVGINNRGQIVGQEQMCSVCPWVLWSPNGPNATAGSPVTIPVPFAFSINSFGQVAGFDSLWTPSSPNGTVGTTITQFYGIIGINDFGQVIWNPEIGAEIGGPQLFTPSTAHGSTGSAISIPLNPVAISNNGTVLGAGQDSRGNWQGFLWTPTSPNGTSGAISEIPIPAGFTQLQPLAINDSSQVTGYLQSNCCVVPFLYTGGAVYDLTAVDSRLSGHYPTAINAAGQVVLVGTDGITYLLSPTPLPAPPGPQTVPVTIDSLPSGSGFVVSGTGCSAGAYVAPQALNWISQSSCTVAFVSPESDTITGRYVFSGWQDGSATNPRAIVAPLQPTTYTANYATQYLLTTISNPLQGGTVSGGGWYGANSTAVLTATAAGGFRFSDWASPPFVSVLGPSSASITMFGPYTVTADFAVITGPALTNYAVTLLGPGGPAVSPRPLNSFGQVVFGSSLWTPFTPNGTSGSAVDLGFTTAGINSRGQVAGTANAQAVLWSPATPNGSSGSAIPVPVSPSAAGGINSYGQGDWRVRRGVCAANHR